MPDKATSIEERVQSLQEQLQHIERVLAQISGQVVGLQAELKNKRTQTAPPVTSKHDENPSPPVAPASSDFSAEISAKPLWPFRTESQQQQARRDWEAIVGGNWFNKIGIGAIILGIAFFLRYAIENEWLGNYGKVALGITVGLLFLAGGERYHRRDLQLFARGLSGGGAAILYLSLYFAFQIYQIMPQAVAFVLMTLVTAATVALSLRYDSRAILLFAMFGGFFTPFWMSTGFGRPLALFTYLAILDLGLVAIAWRKHWKFVNSLCFFATTALYFAWYSTEYQVSQFALAEVFLLIFYLIFAALAFFIHLAQRQRTQPFDALNIAGNALFYFTGNLALLESLGAEKYRGLFTAGMALLYAGFSLAAWRRNREDKLLLFLLIGAAVTFLTLFFPIALKDNWVPLAWLMETLVLATLGSLLRLEQLQRLGLLVGVIAWLALYFYVIDHGGMPIAAGEWVTYLLGTIGVLAAIFLQSRTGGNTPADFSRGLVAWEIMTLLTLPFLLADYWTSLAVLMIAALLLILAQLRFASPLPQLISLYLAPAATLIIFFREYNPHWIRLENFAPVLNSRFLLYIAAAALLGWYLFIQKNISKDGSASRLDAWLSHLVKLQLIALPCFALTLDALSFYNFREQASGYTVNLRAPRHLTLSALWSTYSLLLLIIGIWKRLFTLRLAALLLFAITILKVAFVDFWLFEKIYRIVSAILFGAILVYASYLYQRHKEKILAAVMGNEEEKINEQKH